MLALGLCVALLLNTVPELAFGQSRRPPSRPATRTTPVRPPLTRTQSARTPVGAGMTSLRPMDDEAIRLMKLGNTYREARNYDLAQKYINQGLEMATRSGNRYWQATGYEYLGLTYRDMGDRPAALSALQRASDLFAEIIKSRSPRSSRNSTQMLLDNMMRDDASRLQPMPTPSPSSPLPATALRPRDIAPRPQGALQAERDLNAQLTARLASLESRIRALDSANSPMASPSPGAGTTTMRPATSSAAPPTSANPPGAIARTMPPRPVGDKPQGEFAPYQTDKKPVPVQTKPTQPPVKKDSVVSLPIFTLQIGVGAGYALNRPLMAIPPATATATPTEFTGLSGGLAGQDFSFPLLSISGDFFLSPQFSLGLMYAYYPGLTRNDSLQVRTVSALGVVSTTSSITKTYTDYHFLTLRPSFHIVRNQTADFYVGLALGSMLNFQPLRLYAGLLTGFQYNFTRQVGAFIELSGGGHYTGTTTFNPTPTYPGTNPLLISINPGIINLAAYGRLGLAINF